MSNSLSPVPGGVDTSTATSELRDAEQLLNTVAQVSEGQRARPESAVEKAAVAIDSVATAASNSAGLDLLWDGVNSLVDNLPGIVKALDDISRIHPYIAVAVGAFKVVIELEVKRRDNDKKVELLFLEMKNMMSALLQLNNVRPSHVGRDGLTIGARLESLIKQTASDIKECANACDTYMKKRLLVKVLKSGVWDETLKGYVQTFADRKTAFVFAVSVHTGMAVDRANDKLDQLMTRMDVLLDFFEQAVSRDQRILKVMIERAGGTEEALKAPDVMQELLEREKSFDPVNHSTATDSHTAYATRSRHDASQYTQYGGINYSRAAERRRANIRTTHARTRAAPGTMAGDGPRRHPYHATPYYSGAPHDYVRPYVLASRGGRSSLDSEDAKGALQELNAELLEPPLAAIRSNLQSFERKFEILQQELVDEMRKIVVHEGDRVINTVLSGPHDRIVDPDLYEIWKDMRWRGIVKARHLVLAIHDYYLQKLDDLRNGVQSPGRILNESDVWAVEQLDLTHLQPILEVLDEDASGFVTIQEVNKFTTARPQGWSLPHWLAYWAIGWQLAMTDYRDKIISIFNAMSELSDDRSDVRHYNRPWIRWYLDAVQSQLNQMAPSFQGNTEKLSILPRFQAYIAQEEARVRKHLETANYDLDAPDTLAYINGRGGLERNLFTLLYLLLIRHYNVMRMGQQYLLHSEELVDAESSVHMVQDVCEMRRESLSLVFQQRRLAVYQELEYFANGTFNSSNDRMLIEYIPGKPSVATEETYSVPMQREGLKHLKYPPLLEEFYPEDDDGLRDCVDPDHVDESIKGILGSWIGIFGHDIYPEIHLHFHASMTNPKQLVAVPLLWDAWRSSRTTCIGERAQGCGPNGNPLYTITVQPNCSAQPPIYLQLELSDDGLTLRGVCNTSREGSLVILPGNQAIMKRRSTRASLIHYPSPDEFAQNAPRALWRFAIHSILNTVYSQGIKISWKRIVARRTARRRLASIMFLGCTGELPPHLHNEQWELAVRMHPADYHFTNYATLEPLKFPWLLPACSVRGLDCQALLPTILPCLRCCSPQCRPPLEQYASHGWVICENPLCLEEHLASEGISHCVVKTRAEDWSMDKFKETTGRDIRQLLQRAEDMQNLLVTGLGDYVPSRGSSVREPSRLSTISERDEETGDLNMSSDPMRRSSTVESLQSGAGKQVRFRLVADGDRLVSEPEEMDARMSVKAIKADGPTGATLDLRTASFPSLDPAHDATLLTTAHIDDSNPRGSPQTCIQCKEKIFLPCWACAECAGMLCICTSCDSASPSGIAFPECLHSPTHTLLYLPPPALTSETESIPAPAWVHYYREPYTDATNDNDTMSAIEKRVERLEERFGVMEEGVARMERMLEAALSLLRSGADPTLT